MSTTKRRFTKRKSKSHLTKSRNQLTRGCGEGPGRNVGMGTGVPVPRAECGPGAAVGRGALRIPGGAAARITGRCGTTMGECSAGPTHGGSRREATWKLGAVGSLRTPSRAIRLARQTHHACSMQHDACSMQRATCSVQRQATEMQLPPCTRRQHVGIDALCRIAPFGPAKPTPKPKPRQGRADERTMADSDMSVNLAPEAVVATTSGARG